MLFMRTSPRATPARPPWRLPRPCPAGRPERCPRMACTCATWAVPASRSPRIDWSSSPCPFVSLPVVPFLFMPLRLPRPTRVRGRAGHLVAPTGRPARPAPLTRPRAPQGGGRAGGTTARQPPVSTRPDPARPACFPRRRRGTRSRPRGSAYSRGSWRRQRRTVKRQSTCCTAAQCRSSARRRLGRCLGGFWRAWRVGLRSRLVISRR